MKTLIDLPDFPGFEPTGKLRIPERGEYFYFNTGKSTIEMAHGGGSHPYLIYRKLKTPVESATEYKIWITPNDIYEADIIENIDWSGFVKNVDTFVTTHGDMYEAIKEENTIRLILKR